MNLSASTRSAAAVLAAATAITKSSAAAPAAVDDFVAKITSTDDAVRGPAWQSAATIGAGAIGPLGEVMTHHDFEIARAAKRAIERITRHAGRPGAENERKAVQGELLGLLARPSAPVRCHALWMLSEIADADAVKPIAALLSETDVHVRDASRCALERLPAKQAIAALKTAMRAAPEEFKEALAHSLRVRGERVSGYPTKKLTPVRSPRA